MTGPLHVLLVEDSEDDALLILDVLRTGGYTLQPLRVDTESSLREALCTGCWDIVLSDYHLPAFSARDTLRVITEGGHDIPVIVISGTVGEDIAVETLKMGAVDYLLKPSLTRLVPAVERALRNVIEHRRKDQTLREERDFSNAVLNGLPGIFCQFEDNGRLLRWNRNLESVTGYGAAELAAMRVLDFFTVEDKGRVTALVDEVYRQGEARFEGELLLKDRRRIPYLFTGVRFEHAGLRGFISIGTDIAELRRMETERRQAEQRLRQLATYDGITDLPNRNLIQERIAQSIEHARARGRRFALLYVDMDRFKVINDGYGHAFGDTVLKAIGRRLLLLMDESATVARHGGDEFLILLPELADATEAYETARQVIVLLDSPLPVQDRHIHLSGSIGVSVYPEDGDCVETLIRNADIAMYRAKNLGRNNCQFFSRDLSEQTLLRARLETSLRSAIEAGDLELVYQPKVSLHDGRLTGAEALVRWTHPELGAVSPGVFVSIAEEAGLIIPLSDWVLRTACAQACRLQQAGLPVRIAVNISARQFLQQDVATWALRTLESVGAPPSSLELELTETALAQDIDRMIRTFNDLKEAGVRIAIDDFGTGHSSLSYLTRFRADTLKIDQSFVHGMTSSQDDATVARTIITLGHSLGMSITAEGADREEHLRILRQYGCDEVQGYWISPPVAAEQFETLLRGGRLA